MKNPTKAGQKFTHYGSLLTVKSFAGKTGKEFLTLDECIKQNPTNSPVIIFNKEHKGGATSLDKSKLI